MHQSGPSLVSKILKIAMIDGKKPDLEDFLAAEHAAQCSSKFYHVLMQRNFWTTDRRKSRTFRYPSRARQSSRTSQTLQRTNESLIQRIYESKKATLKKGRQSSIKKRHHNERHLTLVPISIRH